MQRENKIALYETIMRRVGNVVKNELLCSNGMCSLNYLNEDDEYSVNPNLCKGSLYADLQQATQERAVERAYSNQFKRFFKKGSITYPCECDGYVEEKLNDGNTVRLIMEFKYGKNIHNSMERAKVLLQVIYYLKMFEDEGVDMPNTCFVGDEDECFVMHTNPLIKYLDYNLNWNLAPSVAPSDKGNIQVLRDIAQDREIDPMTYTVDKNFKFCDIDQEIYNLNSIEKRYINVNEKNISRIFELFCNEVLIDRNKFSAHDLVDIFIGSIIDPLNYFVNENGGAILFANGRKVNINQRNFNAFFKTYGRDYSPEEKRKFTQIADILIEDTDRRNKGDFFTPRPFVLYANKMISEQFGHDWKDKYVVWDCACGTKNLTKDFSFRELYSSTLEQGELNISQKYNTNSVAFQFDFLNDPLEGNLLDGCKLPKGLLDALRNDKPILFFINPPYGTAGNRDETSKEGISNTMILKLMSKDGMGACSLELYALFLYRIIKIKKLYHLTNIKLCLFCKPLYLTGSSFAKLRELFCNEFQYDEGILFNASYFADCSNAWGIDFTIWENGKTKDTNTFPHTNVILENGKIVTISTKDLYNMDGLTKAGEWAKIDIRRIPVVEAPNLSSGLTIKETNTKICLNSLGYINNGGNNISLNSEMVILFTSPYSNAHGFSILPLNFTKCTSLFSARKLIKGDWINDKDEYLEPDTNSKYWKEFENDSIIYSLFHPSSNQSSLRQVEYHNKLWDIKNEFFWMPVDEIQKLANKNNNDECYEDCVKAEDERYVYKLLQGGLYTKLSREAADVLDDAIDLVRKSFPYRLMFNNDHPDYQINNWDCGYYQLKGLWKEYMPEEFDAFRAKVKALGDKMRPMVYLVGFLKK